MGHCVEHSVTVALLRSQGQQCWREYEIASADGKNGKKKSSAVQRDRRGEAWNLVSYAAILGGVSVEDPEIW